MATKLVRVGMLQRTFNTLRRSAFIRRHWHAVLAVSLCAAVLVPFLLHRLVSNLARAYLLNCAKSFKREQGLWPTDAAELMVHHPHLRWLVVTDSDNRSGFSTLGGWSYVWLDGYGFGLDNLPIAALTHNSRYLHLHQSDRQNASIIASGRWEVKDFPSILDKAGQPSGTRILLLKQRIAREPRCTRHRVGIIASLQQMGRRQEALSECDQWLREMPGATDWWPFLARAALRGVDAGAEGVEHEWFAWFNAQEFSTDLYRLLDADRCGEALVLLRHWMRNEMDGSSPLAARAYVFSAALHCYRTGNWHSVEALLKPTLDPLSAAYCGNGGVPPAHHALLAAALLAQGKLSEASQSARLASRHAEKQEVRVSFSGDDQKTEWVLPIAWTQQSPSDSVWDAFAFELQRSVAEHRTAYRLPEGILFVGLRVFPTYE